MAHDETVCVFGLGYVGLPTAALLATRGYNVLGVDVRHEVVETINRGEIHIVEPDLDAHVRAAVSSGALRAAASARASDVYVIAVPTPLTHEKKPELAFVFSAVDAISAVLEPGAMIILESTSPVGTMRAIADRLGELGHDVDRLDLAYCPERVLPGRTMIELVENDRVVGGFTPAAGERVASFYRTFVSGEVLVTNARTAEMCKLVENAYRDVNIAFANELSILADRFGVDAREMISLANHHPRVNILSPGPGVGGHCIAVDPWFLVYGNEDESRLIHTARAVNLRKTEWVIDQVALRAREIAGSTRGARVACFGLAYKPNTDDLRESPALEVARRLEADGLDLVVVEPNVKSCAPLELVSVQSALDQADLLVGLVAHQEFAGLDLKGREVLDFAGAFRP